MYKGNRKVATIMYKYNPKDVCSKEISFDIKNGHVVSVSFIGGCSGNLQGIGKLIEGMEVHEAIDKLSGIKCGTNHTSCPDQLSIALKEAIEK